ncbi:carboxypeptidase regulatory-like domain-containing protein [Corallococcus sp. bb12-1]|uniref:carboxypeptidase regulatory-like domain-containing protein n=1 Tax=Corallococcus sp. bb12-1 TaxID=2996784 RepID=UPI002270C842|nr:carboxypeptidase regulatory-like domain-containing protein [Corallococcus sp. bb12-1]MCY1040499.1 carboxypeptidase regulatory-like domain-containing protein [Corallococcus sp. bb12-1]
MRLSPSVLLLSLMLTLAACQEPGMSPAPPPLPTPVDPVDPVDPTDPSGPARVVGTVSLEGATNAAGVQVSLTGTELRATTNAAGAFVLEKVPAGTYELTAARTGYTQARQSLSVDADDSVEVSLALLRARGRVSGVLTLEGSTDGSGVTVTLEGANQTATTDAQGRFALEGVPTGSYVLKASRTGYATVSQPVEVTEGNDTLLTLLLGRYRGRIEGQVRLSDSAPALGVAVALEGTDTATTTDSQGRFALEGVVTGTYSLVASKEGYTAVRQSVEVKATGSSSVTLSLTRHRGTLQGQVTLDGATQAPGVTVMLEGTSAVTTSTSQGRFTLGGVPTGTYVLVATKTGYTTVRQSVEVTQDATTTVTLPLILSRGDLVGQVLLEGGVSPSGIALQLEGTATSTATDAEGRFTLPGVPTGSYALLATKADYTTTRQAVEVKEAASTSVTLTLARSRGRVEGVALLDDAQDPAGTQVSLRGLTGVTTTDAQGRFVLEGVPTGSYLVDTVRAGYTSPQPLVQVQADATASVSMTLERRYGSIQGRVTLEGRTNHSGVRIDLVGRTDSVTTNASGSFQFTRLPPGDYSLQATLSPYETVNVSVSVALDDSRSTNITMSLLRGDVTGTVLLEEVAAGSLDGTEVTLTGTSLRATTQADGTFTLAGVPVGTYEVRASRSTHAEQRASVTVVAKQSVSVSLQLSRLRGQVVGQVVLSDGGELSGITVFQSGLATPITPDAQGHFALVGLPTGGYVLKALKEGYAKAEQSVTVSANATTNVSLQLTRLPPPTFTSIPSLAVQGGWVTLTGTNLGDAPGSSQVTVNGSAPAQVISWSQTGVVVRMPYEVPPGIHPVVFKTGVPQQTLTAQVRVVAQKTLAIGDSWGLGILPDATVQHLADSSVWSNAPASLKQGIVSIAAEDDYGMVLKENGTVDWWGYNTDHVGDPPRGLSGVVAITTGYGFAVALKNDGTLVSWGSVDSPASKAPPGVTDVIAISGGRTHALALRADGTVVAWGNNSHGAATVPQGLTDVVEVSAGTVSSVARKVDGSLVTWGTHSPERPLPQGLTGVRTVALSRRDNHGLAVLSDESVIAWGESSTNLNGSRNGLPPPVQTQVVALAMGSDHANAVLHQDGTLTLWGGYSDDMNTLPPGKVLRVPAR